MPTGENADWEAQYLPRRVLRRDKGEQMTHRWMAMLGAVPVIVLLLAAGSVSAQTEPARAQVVGHDEGDVLVDPDGGQVRFKVGSVSTGASQLTIATFVWPPGLETVTHLHEIDEEVLYVFHGELTVTLEGQEYTAGPGGTIFVPPGTWMKIANHTNTSAFGLFILPRGEVEECFRVFLSEQADEAARREAVELCKIRYPTARSGQ